VAEEPDMPEDGDLTFAALPLQAVNKAPVMTKAAKTAVAFLNIYINIPFNVTKPEGSLYFINNRHTEFNSIIIVFLVKP